MAKPSKSKSTYRPPQKGPAAAKKQTLSPAILLGLIAGAVIIVVGIVVLATQAANAPLVATERVGEGTAWGPEDAPVQIVDFSDFGCSHCGNFALNQGKLLRAEYEASGQVRFEFKHMIIGGQATRDAANAAECAADQGRFWDYHDALFARARVTPNPFTKPMLQRYAAELGMDTATFDACVNRDTHYAAVAADESEARSRGINATPTFFINGKKIEGALPYEQFKAEVDAALAAAGQ